MRKVSYVLPSFCRKYNAICDNSKLAFIIFSTKLNTYQFISILFHFLRTSEIHKL